MKGDVSRSLEHEFLGMGQGIAMSVFVPPADFCLSHTYQ